MPTPLRPPPEPGLEVTVPHPRLRPIGAVALALALAVAATACGSDGPGDTEQQGARDRAVERLHDYGLTTGQAECVVDELGAPAVVEAPDLNALTDGQDYQDAVSGCVDGS
jgi:hypothetical protein